MRTISLMLATSGLTWLGFYSGPWEAMTVLVLVIVLAGNGLFRLEAIDAERNSEPV